MADIELEFRTTKMNGVLLSVSELKGSPSLSLSIDEGTVSCKYFCCFGRTLKNHVSIL